MQRRCSKRQVGEGDALSAAQRAGSEQGSGDNACGDGRGVEALGGIQFGETGLHRTHRFFLVGLEGEEVVASGFVDLGGDVGMAAPGVDTHQSALEFEQRQQTREGIHFVALLAAHDLSGADAGLAHPGSQDRHHLRLGGGGDGSAPGFAVDLDLASGQIAAPVGEDVEKGLRPEGDEDIAENVVAGRPVREGPEGAQPLDLGLAESLHVGEGVVVREHGAKGDQEDLVDAVQDMPLPAGVGHPREAVAEQFEG